MSALLSDAELMEMLPIDQLPGWQDSTIDELGNKISWEIRASGHRRTKGIGARREPEPPPPDYWSIVKRELHILICTGDKKYADLRKKIDKAGTRSQTTIVSMIAAAIASSIGVVAGYLVPLCALVLLAVVRVGRNVFCQRAELNMHVAKKR